MKLRMLTFLIVAVSLAATSSTQAEDVTITIDTDNPGWTISNYLTGMHTIYGDEPDALWESPVLSKWMKEARVGIIRYPGGTTVHHWHWDDPNGISFKSDTWKPGYDDKPRSPEKWMDLEEFITFCRKVGAEPMVGINNLSGKKYNRRADSLESARQLIQHCTDRDYRVNYWYIGNECFIGLGPKKYIKDINDYAKVLRSVDPDITIVGDWKFGPESKDRFAQTLEIVKQAKELDVMEIHEKYGLSDDGWGLRRDGYTAETTEGWQEEAGLFGGRFDYYIEEFLRETKDRKRPVKLGFNEWAAEHKQDAYVSALMKADYLVSMFKYPVLSACDWRFHSGTGAPVQFNKKTAKVKTTPTADLYTMLSSAQGLQHLPMRTSEGNVYGFAALRKDSKTIEVYVLNKKSTAVEAAIKLGESTSKISCTVEVSSFVKPGKVRTLIAIAATTDAVPPIKLPALSFSRITLTR